MTPTRLGVAWTAAALLGIVVTAALTWSVGRLAGQRIGLSSAPPSAISGLAPVRPARHGAGAAPDPAPAQSPPSRSAGTRPRATSATSATSAPGAPTTSAAVAPTTTAVGPTPAAPPAAAPSRSSGGEDGGDRHSSSARSGGGRDD